ncbi:MAG: glycerophosphodiester phosphodiesterase [Oscillospiraceae bacterium]|nr:glycerophosphodiester phosphodiesterase [Oscillospiraceae bacterium]
MLTVLIVLLVLLCAYLLLLMPRTNHPGWDKLSAFRYAHRGLHDKEQGIPENSLPAFRRAVEHGFGAELDVHLLKDGSLAVFHDSSLKRICGVDGKIEDLTAQDLKNYHLLGTEETIPLFTDVLALFEGKTPLIVELKVVDGNAAALTDAAMALLREWNGTYCIESFHPAAVAHMKKRYNDVIRGQLTENFFRERKPSVFIAFLMTLLLTTAFTRPDFIACDYRDRSNISLRLMRRLYKVHEVGWTIREQSTMELLEQDGVTPIFENFIP